MLNLIAQSTTLNSIKSILPFTAEDAGAGAENLISTTIGFITLVAGIAFLLYLIIAGFNWITAGGDPEKVKKAQANITNAILGLIIIVIAYAVTSVIGSIFGFSILSPAKIIDQLGPTSPAQPDSSTTYPRLEDPTDTSQYPDQNQPYAD